MSILEAITKNIQYHEAELAKLRVARDVVAHLQETPLKALQVEGVATTSSVAGNASFVATHLKHNGKRTPVIRRRERTDRKELRQRIVDLMKDEAPRSASDVTAALKIGSQSERAAAWRILTKLKTAKVLSYEDLKYQMPPMVAQLESVNQ